MTDTTLLETPRTDAAQQKHLDSPGSTLWVLSLNLAVLARQLERELAQALRNNQELMAQLIEAQTHLEHAHEFLVFVDGQLFDPHCPDCVAADQYVKRAIAEQG